MALIFHVKGANKVSTQRVSLRPVEHHYENEGEEEYIKYGCQLCEDIAQSYPNDLMDKRQTICSVFIPKGN